MGRISRENSGKCKELARLLGCVTVLRWSWGWFCRLVVNWGGTYAIMLRLIRADNGLAFLAAVILLGFFFCSFLYFTIALLDHFFSYLRLDIQENAICAVLVFGSFEINVFS